MNLLSNEQGEAMTWRDVLDVKPGTNYGHILVFARAARLLGYRFIAWNGEVYFIVDESELIDTGVSSDDLSVAAA